MAGHAKWTKKQRNAAIIAGLKKHLLRTTTFVLGGRRYTTDELVALLQSQLDLLALIASLEGKRRDAVAQERTLEQRMANVAAGLRDIVHHTFGDNAEKLAEFGFTLRKKTGPKTNEVKVEAARKATSTRVARGTMGKKQRLKIKG